MSIVASLSLLSLAETDYRGVKIDFSQLPDTAKKRTRKRAPTNVLVTGGAGYIGSQFVTLLLDQFVNIDTSSQTGGKFVTAYIEEKPGVTARKDAATAKRKAGRRLQISDFDYFSRNALDRPYLPIVVDNLSRSHPSTLDRLFELGLEHFYNFDLADTAALTRVMTTHNVSVVVHFAANAFASESIEYPHLYWSNVTKNTRSVHAAAQAAGVTNIVYSSSCATYGDVDAKDIPVSETAPQKPVSPYGASKLAAEKLLLSSYRQHKQQGTPFKVAILRYFNVIGADPRGRIGPMILPQALRKYQRVESACLEAAEHGEKGKGMSVNGVDYLTSDGSVVRDYVHVSDLASAHLAVIEAFEGMGAKATDKLVYNVGCGRGYSVKEFAYACQAATGVQFPIKEHPRRAGDPPYVVGDARLIYAELEWKAKRCSNLTETLMHAWQWRKQADRGGGKVGVATASQPIRATSFADWSRATWGPGTPEGHTPFFGPNAVK